MKKFFVCMAFLGVSLFSHAGIDFIGGDGISTTFTASTGELLISQSDLVLVIDYDDSSVQGSITPAGFTLTTQFGSGMHFSGGSFEFTDENDSSVLISGDIVAVDFINAGGLLVGSGTAEVNVSNLAGFPTGVTEIVSLTFNLNPDFSGFNQDYTGYSKLNFLVPEPATLAILGLGGVVLLRKKR